MVSPTHVVYADIEAILKNEEDAIHHEAVAAGIYCKSHAHFPNSPLQGYNSFSGSNPIRKMLCQLEKLCVDVKEFNEEHTRKTIRSLTSIQESSFSQSTKCYLCAKFSLKLVRDHDHYTGNYIGPACPQCNFQRSVNRNKLNVFFHNGKKYDFHYIIRDGLKYFHHWEISVIASSFENYQTIKCNIKIGDCTFRLNFLDSFQFMSTSLSALIDNCQERPITNKLAVSDSVKFGKGVFPYDFMDHISKLNSTSLPNIDAFYNSLTKSACSIKDYEKAKQAWREFNCTTFGDYMLAYLEMDVRQLADVFEAFRERTLIETGLDPVNFCGIPGLSLSAALKHGNLEVDLLHDENMYKFFERGMRGGMCFVNEHHVKRNVPGESGYDSKIPRTEMLYIDMNNLYGHALSRPLPYRNFRWLAELNSGLESALKAPRDGTVGYTLEVDLEIPAEIHQLTDDLPFAPESKEPKDISRFMKNLWSFNEGDRKYRSTKKLLLTHLAKYNYVIHFALLQYYVNKGAKVTAVHRIVQYEQLPIFKGYIASNSQKRQMSTNSFDKDFYKLLNNSLFGKTCENVRKRIDLRICSKEKQLVIRASKPRYLDCKVFATADNDIEAFDIVGVHLLKKNVELDKMIFAGQAVLDLSKLEMYELRYEQLASQALKFGGDIRIAGGDTDSFFLKITNIDLKTQLLPAMIQDGLLDTSNYPADHPFHSTKYKAKLGCVKDECCGDDAMEWILLTPKCYSMRCRSDQEIKRAKGIQRAVISREMRHQHYKTVYETSQPAHFKTTSFVSSNHKIATVSKMKKSLSLFDDKRYWIDRNDSFAYGNYLCELFENDLL